MGNRLASSYKNTNSGNSILQIQTMTNSSNAYGWNYTIKADATTVLLTATLPTSVGNVGKQIEIIKIDNSANPVAIAPYETEMINGSTNKIYLYNQNDSIVIRSDGTNSYIVSDNRNSVGQSKSFLGASMQTSQTTNITTNDHIKFDTLSGSYGGDISFDLSTTYTNTNNVESKGRFTLKASKTYRLVGKIEYATFSTSTGVLEYAWYNADTGTKVGNISNLASLSSTGNDIRVGYSEAIVSPIVNTRYELRITGVTNVTAIGFTNTTTPTAYIECLSTPANIVNTVDYLEDRRSGSSQTGLASNSDFIYNTVMSGNIPYNTSTGLATLTAGKTYKITTINHISDINTYTQIGVYDSSNNLLSPFSELLAVSGTSNNSSNGTIDFIYTPVTNIQIKIRSGLSASTFNLRSDLFSGMTITQIGSTAQTLNSGTQEQRLAMSPTDGYEFYQVDESKGKYVYNGTRWDKISNLAYLKASNTATVNPSANTLLNFSAGVISNGIKTNMGGGRYELYAGVYELMGVQTLNENEAGISFQFYNYSTSSYIGEKGNAADVLGSAGTASPAFAILECTVDTQIGLRCSNDSATVTATEGNWLKIKQIS